MTAPAITRMWLGTTTRSVNAWNAGMAALFVILKPEKPMNDTVYLIVQEGGSSSELYVHAWDTRKDAEQDRIDCASDGAYRTSKVVEAPADLVNHPEFYSVVEDLLRASRDLECVDEWEDDDDS
jgi:hypothetical protein